MILDRGWCHKPLLLICSVWIVGQIVGRLGPTGVWWAIFEKQYSAFVYTRPRRGAVHQCFSEQHHIAGFEYRLPNVLWLALMGANVARQMLNKIGFL